MASRPELITILYGFPPGLKPFLNAVAQFRVRNVPLEDESVTAYLERLFQRHNVRGGDILGVAKAMPCEGAAPFGHLDRAAWDTTAVWPYIERDGAEPYHLVVTSALTAEPVMRQLAEDDATRACVPQTIPTGRFRGADGTLPCAALLVGFGGLPDPVFPLALLATDAAVASVDESDHAAWRSERMLLLPLGKPVELGGFFRALQVQVVSEISLDDGPSEPAAAAAAVRTKPEDFDVRETDGDEPQPTHIFVLGAHRSGGDTVTHLLHAGCYNSASQADLVCTRELRPLGYEPWVSLNRGAFRALGPDDDLVAMHRESGVV